MQKSILFVLGILILSLPFLAFDCSSTELTSAKLYIQQKNWDRALEVLQAEVQKNPKSDEGYYLLGTVYSELDQPEKTLEAFDNSLAISDKYSKNIKEYRTYHWAEYFNRGVSLFQRGSKTADKDSTKMYYDMSIEAYNNAIMFQPDSGETYRNLAFVYLTTGQTEASVEPLKKLIELANVSTPPTIGISSSELEKEFGKPDAIVETKYKDIDVISYVYNKGNLNVYLENNTVVGFQRITNSDGGEEGYQYLGEVYYSLGAEIMNNFKMNSNSADSVKAMDYFNSAIVTLDEGLAKYPDNTEMHNTKFNSYIATGRMEEALSSAKALVDKDPGNKYYHYNYGVVLLKVSRFQEAESELLKAIEIDPEYENAIYNLGVNYVSWGTAMNKEAEQKGVMSEEYKQKYQAALPYMEKVVQNDPENAQMWELLGKIYSVLGMNEDANNAFKKADELR